MTCSFVSLKIGKLQEIPYDVTIPACKSKVVSRKFSKFKNETLMFKVKNFLLDSFLKI